VLRDDDDDLLTLIERNERLIAASDLRDEIRRTAPADLAALQIDRPDLRWQAARAYIRATRGAAIARIDLGLRRIVLLDKIAASSRRRGAAMPDESDVADAQLAFTRIFGEAPPDLKYMAKPFAGRTSEAELLRLASDERRHEAARKAWLRQLLAA
jgi:hypothetical protein